MNDLTGELLTRTIKGNSQCLTVKSKQKNEL